CWCSAIMRSKSVCWASRRGCGWVIESISVGFVGGLGYTTVSADAAEGVAATSRQLATRAVMTSGMAYRVDLRDGIVVPFPVNGVAWPPQWTCWDVTDLRVAGPGCAPRPGRADHDRVSCRYGWLVSVSLLSNAWCGPAAASSEMMPKTI